jgi:hypothetical protein
MCWLGSGLGLLNSPGLGRRVQSFRHFRQSTQVVCLDALREIQPPWTERLRFHRVFLACLERYAHLPSEIGGEQVLASLWVMSLGSIAQSLLCKAKRRGHCTATNAPRVKRSDASSRVCINGRAHPRRHVPKLCPSHAFLAVLPCLPERRITNLQIPDDDQKNESLFLR